MEFIKPKRMPEAVIQAELYRRLRNKGVSVCLEYITPCKIGRSGKVRLDVVVIVENKIKAIIECKTRSKETGFVNTANRQHVKYMSLGVPLLYCIHYDYIDFVIEQIDKLLNGDDAIDWRGIPNNT